jgi:hypothetical protein
MGQKYLSVFTQEVVFLKAYLIEFVVSCIEWPIYCLSKIVHFRGSFPTLYSFFIILDACYVAGESSSYVILADGKDESISQDVFFVHQADDADH